MYKSQDLIDQSPRPVATIAQAPNEVAVDALRAVGQDLMGSAPQHRMSSLQDLEAGRFLETRLGKKAGGSGTAKPDCFVGELRWAQDGTMGTGPVRLHADEWARAGDRDRLEVDERLPEILRTPPPVSVGPGHGWTTVPGAPPSAPRASRATVRTQRSTGRLTRHGLATEHRCHTEHDRMIEHVPLH